MQPRITRTAEEEDARIRNRGQDPESDADLKPIHRRSRAVPMRDYSRTVLVPRDVVTYRREQVIVIGPARGLGWLLVRGTDPITGAVSRFPVRERDVVKQ